MLKTILGFSTVVIGVVSLIIPGLLITIPAITETMSIPVTGLLKIGVGVVVMAAGIKLIIMNGEKVDRDDLVSTL